jgi:hypothetical protein
MEVFGVLEMSFQLDGKTENPSIELLAENQVIKGDALEDGTIRIRYCPKATDVYLFKLQSNLSAWHGRVGGITVVSPPIDAAAKVDLRLPNWWTDSPRPELQEGPHLGAKSVNQWREAYLRDFAERMRRCLTAKPSSS